MLQRMRERGGEHLTITNKQNPEGDFAEHPRPSFAFVYPPAPDSGMFLETSPSAF